MDCAAAILANEEQPLAAGPGAACHAAETMFGTEMVLQMMFPRNAHVDWAKCSQRVYQPTITDPLFQRERFYVPLMTYLS